MPFRMNPFTKKLDFYEANTDLDVKVLVSSNDTTAGYLNGKLVAGTGISLTEGNDGGNETLTIASSVTSLDINDLKILSYLGV